MNNYKKIFFLAFFIYFVPAGVWADEIYLNDGTVIIGRLQIISLKNVTYQTFEKFPMAKSIPRKKVEKIIYDDGNTVFFNQEFQSLFRSRNRKYNSRSSSSSLFPIPLRLSLVNLQGDTTVNLYDNNDKAVASGQARLNQYIIRFSRDSYKKKKSCLDYYLTPEVGYFYRTIKVKDFSYQVDNDNTYKEGFIPGIVTDPNTGAQISKKAVSSLAYSAKFHSYFGELKTGIESSFGSSSFQFVMNPYVSLSVLELRKSIFEFNIYKDTESFSNPYAFSFFKSYGYGIEFGFYLPGKRIGVLIGYEKRFLSKFNLPSDIRFKGVYYDESLQIMRTEEIQAQYTDIKAGLLSINAYYVF